jgi:hypothetical protein
MASNLLDRHYLTPLFEPASVAIIGASTRAGSIGAVLIDNMLAAGYRGALFAVNPKQTSIKGVPCFPGIDKVPHDGSCSYCHAAGNGTADHEVRHGRRGR